MSNRRLALVFLIVALALAGWGAAAYFDQPSAVEARPAVTVDQPERALGQLKAGEVYDLDFVLNNAGGKACRLIGAPFV